MNDHTDLPDLPTPPDEPLDPAARARARERVVAGLADTPDRRTGARTWLVPLAASVAVAALVAVAVVVGGTRGDSPDAGPAGTVPTSANPTTTDPVPPTPDLPTTMPPETASPPTPPVETGIDAAKECGREVRSVLPGAEPGVSVDDPTGSTVFYVASDRFTLCDTHGGRATVHHAKPLAGGGPYNVWEISTVFDDRGKGATFVAGGPVPPDSPDFVASYTFADGHVQDSATFGDPERQLWWLVIYPAPDGVKALDGPVRFAFRNVADGDTEGTLDLMETCAQANHGC